MGAARSCAFDHQIQLFLKFFDGPAGLPARVRRAAAAVLIVEDHRPMNSQLFQRQQVVMWKAGAAVNDDQRRSRTRSEAAEPGFAPARGDSSVAFAFAPGDVAEQISKSFLKHFCVGADMLI